MDPLQQILVSLGPVAVTIFTVWRMLVQMRAKREDADLKLREYFQLELAARDERIKKRDCELDELRDAQFASQQHVSRLVSEINDERRHRLQADERADLAHQDLMRLQKQTSELLIQNNALQAKVAEIPPLQAQAETLHRRLNELTHQLDMTTRENQELKEENLKLDKENREYEQRIVGLNGRLNEMQGKVSQLATRVGQLERENHRLEKKVKEIDEEESS